MSDSKGTPALQMIIGAGVLTGFLPLIHLGWVMFIGGSDRDSYGTMVAQYLSASGALVSAALFFGAILLQRHELELQRTELALARDAQVEQANALRDQTKHAAEQARSLQVQSRLTWEATVTALVTEAIKLREGYETARETKTREMPLGGLQVAVERAERLVDDLTRRGTDEFVLPYVRDAWRKAVGLEPLGHGGR